MKELMTPGVPFIEALKLIEDEMLKRGGIKGKGQVQHRYADGVYCREYYMVPGQVAVSMMHRKKNFLVLLTGEVTIWSESGKSRLKAPQLLTTWPGTKRIVKAHTEVTIVTFQGSHETNLEKLEEELMVPSDEEIKFMKQLDNCEDAHRKLGELALYETSKKLLGRTR
jgi:hypothetical protein